MELLIECSTFPSAVIESRLPTESRRVTCGHRYRGFNLFDDDDQSLFEVLCRGELLIHGLRNRSLRQHLKQFRPSQIWPLLKRLRLHGIIKKVGNTCKYYLTQLGRHVAIAALTLKNLFLVQSPGERTTHRIR